MSSSSVNLLTLLTGKLSPVSGKTVHCAHTFATIYLSRSFKAQSTLLYGRTSMARTSLGPWKIVRDMDSSTH